MSENQNLAENTDFFMKASCWATLGLICQKQVIYFLFNFILFLHHTIAQGNETMFYQSKVTASVLQQSPILLLTLDFGYCKPGS